jgi:hypothetical protein
MWNRLKLLSFRATNELPKVDGNSDDDDASDGLNASFGLNSSFGAPAPKKRNLNVTPGRKMDDKPLFHGPPVAASAPFASTLVAPPPMQAFPQFHIEAPPSMRTEAAPPPFHIEHPYGTLTTSFSGLDAIHQVNAIADASTAALTSQESVSTGTARRLRSNGRHAIRGTIARMESTQHSDRKPSTRPLTSFATSAVPS